MGRRCSAQAPEWMDRHVDTVQEGDVIRRGTKVGSFAAVAMFALAAGGIAAALLVPSDLDIHGNTITAGHLQVEINQSDGTQLSLDNMAPGEHRVAYQLVTGNMSGVATADLGMTLFSADADGALPQDDKGRLFAENASLTVSVSAPEPESTINWSNGKCTPTTTVTQIAAFTHIADMPVTGSGATSIPIGVFTGDATTASTPVPGNNAVCVQFDIGLDASAGNEVQATSGSFAMSYTLTQTAAASS